MACLAGTVLLLLFSWSAFVAPASPCPALGALAVSDGTILCTLDDLESCQGQILTGQVWLTGSDSKSVWDLSAAGDGSISIGEDTNLTIACVSANLEREEGIALRPVSLDTLLLPPFIQTPDGSKPFVVLRDVEIQVDCGLLLEWEFFLCGIRLPGYTEVQGPRISIISWQTQRANLERVTLVCNPGDAVFSPACSMASVDAVEDILVAAEALQDPTLPLVLTLSSGIDFRAPSWPQDGLRITANVTLSATLGSVVPVSFGLRTVLFQVDSKTSSTAFLSFRGCILVDLPLSYLPLDHPRRPFGILSTGLWPVYREQVAMGLYNCTLILTREEFLFWSFWLSILVSPIPSVRDLASWSFATDVQLLPSGDDYIQLASYYGRYTTLVDVRYQVSNEVFNTEQRNNILQITGDAQVPPTVVYQIRNVDDLLSALTRAPSSSAQQYGQYIILTENLTMSALTSVPAEGMAVSYPTKITTWPTSTVAIDFQLMQNAFALISSVSLKNVVLLNLPMGPGREEFSSLTTGLWSFNVSNWRVLDQQRIALESVALVVPQAEVEYYISSTVNSDSKNINPWISAYKVESYDTENRTWVQFANLATSRFTAQQVNITSTVPHAFGSIAVTLPGSTGDDIITAPAGESSGGVDRREVLLFALLAITLPTALGAALLTYVFLKRRRLSQICMRAEVHGKDEPHKGNMDTLGSQATCDDYEGAGPSRTDLTCCIPFPLPLRKSKFVNPLYEEPGANLQDVVLTEVLGSRRLAPTARPAAGAPALTLLGSGEAPTPTTVESTPNSPWAHAGPAGGRQAASLGGEDATQPGSALDLEALLRSADGRGSRPRSAEQPAPASLQLLTARSAAEGVQAGSGQRSSGSRLLAAAVATGGTAGTAVLPLVPLAPLTLVADGDEQIQDLMAPRPGLEARSSRLAAPRGAGEAASSAAVAGEDAEAVGAEAQRRASGREAGPSRSVGFPEMERLEQLRREIGDRHLEMHHSLGWGGCAVVYKGTWKGLQVAVKTLLVQGESKQSRQFLTEAAISASLQHTNIVTTYLYELRPLDEVDARQGSSGELLLHSAEITHDANGPSGLEPMSCWKLYIVQEYCELGTLKAAIDQGYFKGTRGGLPNMAFLLAIATDISRGLEHVHSKDVVHGDITVSNVLLQAAPRRPHGCIAKIADFGLSIKLEPGQAQHSHMYGGTPHYMAPERTRGVLSKSCDIYSLGVILWELYHGTPAWRRHPGAHSRRYGGEGHSFGSSVDSGSNGQLPWLEAQQRSPDNSGGTDMLTLPRNCPQEYASLVHSCLSSDPQKRPTAAAAAEALQTLQLRFG